MARQKGSKDIKGEKREEIKRIIANRLIYRESLEDTMAHLEDCGYNISVPTYYVLRNELNEDLKDRYINIGKRELLEEHSMTLDTMKELEKRLLREWDACKDPSEKARISQEIRNIKRDLMDYYGSTQIVESVFKFFEEKYGEKAREEMDKVRKEVEKNK